MDPEIINKIKSTFVKWNDTQAYLKAAEMVTEAAPIAAINELRYAGRVFVHSALMARDIPNVFDFPNDDIKNSKTFSESLTIANQYIDNANHDISDTLVYFYSAALTSLAERHGKQLLVSRHEELKTAFEIIDKAKDLIVESRGQISKRKENYIKVRKLMVTMSDLFPTIRDAELLRQMEQSKQENSKMRNIGAGVACGLVVGALFSALIF